MDEDAPATDAQASPLQGRWVGIGCLLVIVAVVVAVVFVVKPEFDKTLEMSNRTNCEDNVRALLHLMIGRVSSEGVRGWPEYDGKNFILSLVADGRLDIRNPRNMEILFCPADEDRCVEHVSSERWLAITQAALRNGADFPKCTSYLGRRNATREHKITADQMKVTTAVIVCPHHAGGYIVGFSGGNVVFVRPEELVDTEEAVGWPFEHISER